MSGCTLCGAHLFCICTMTEEKSEGFNDKIKRLEQQLKDCKNSMNEAAEIIIKLTNYSDGYPYSDEVKILKGGKG